MEVPAHDQPAPRIVRDAKFLIGQVVKHRLYPFRGVIYDVDPTFSNTEEWWQSIPEDVRPRKDQPYYHLLAENAETTYVAYVSEQNLLADDSGAPVNHPDVERYFGAFDGAFYKLKSHIAH
ncbi:MAG: heat shock protein HspQ [Gammaproteobacteria bacterium]|nr:heat shock protein HspQ [Gammaproteobacteria bacterium]